MHARIHGIHSAKNPCGFVHSIAHVNSETNAYVHACMPIFRSKIRQRSLKGSVAGVRRSMPVTTLSVPCIRKNMERVVSIDVLLVPLSIFLLDILLSWLWLLLMLASPRCFYARWVHSQFFLTAGACRRKSVKGVPQNRQEGGGGGARGGEI